MMLQKKLVIGMTAFIFSSIALGANAIQPAHSTKSSRTAHTTVHSSQETQEVPDSVLTPGARLVAGESENEFYILDKNEPMPVKAAANAATKDKEKKPDTAQLNTTLNNVKDKVQLADNETVQQTENGDGAADVSGEASQTKHKHAARKDISSLTSAASEAFEAVANNEPGKEAASTVKQVKHKLAGKKDKVKIAPAGSADTEAVANSETDEEAASTVKQVKHKLAGKKDKVKIAPAEEMADNETADEAETTVKHSGHKLAGKKGLAKVTVVRVRGRHHLVYKHSISKTRVALHRATKHIAGNSAVDQIEVIPHWNAHHHKVAASKKKPAHVETASQQHKHKVVSRRKTVSRVKVAVNEQYKNMFKDTVSSPEIY